MKFKDGLLYVSHIRNTCKKVVPAATLYVKGASSPPNALMSHFGG